MISVVVRGGVAVVVVMAVPAVVEVLDVIHLVNDRRCHHC